MGSAGNPSARRRPAKAALSGIAADKAAGTAYEIINQSINHLTILKCFMFGLFVNHNLFKFKSLVICCINRHISVQNRYSS